MADRLQLLPQPALSEVPGCGGADLACRARGRPPAARLLPRRVHVARRGRRHRVPEQGARLRLAVQGGVGDDADHRGGSQAPRSQDRHHRGPPHLGLGDDPPSARAHDRGGRRHLAGQEPLDLVPAGLPSSGSSARQAVPPAVPRPAGRSARCRPARLLRRPCSSRRAAGIPAPPCSRPEEALGGLRQGAVRRTGGRARLPVALHPPGRDLEPSSVRLQRERRHLPL